ncbi:MAG TPA: energy transducer TonB [Pyrinomonadaceae bacterium]
MILLAGCAAAAARESGTERPVAAPGSRVSQGVDEVVYDRKEVDTPAVILSRPAPMMPEAARQESLSGPILIEFVLSASGVVKDAKVISPTPFALTKSREQAFRELTESALQAAYAIKFEPAIKDGRAVSQRQKIQYNFKLYDFDGDSVVGDSSKRVYYAAGCADYSRIADGNMVSFGSNELAKKAGYKKAKSKCPK